MKKTAQIFLALGALTALSACGPTMTADARDESTETPEAPVAQAIDSEANESFEDEAAEAEVIEKYGSLATIMPEQAREVAEAAQGETATEVELEVEDGSLIYEVEFTDVEVFVDAGNGEILEIETISEEENEAIDTPIRGSIQVPDGISDDE